ncbi:ABC transporter permease [Ktedonospora formicarum]|uniref:Spermidine/putrescine ABC transporter permease n=1 Tax=Ktedonospora formicarum TaxID=2778364 RepID=A0A8J3I5V3_9CHLR|nr:ABC transporter permease subunit [Ktedonospora formicarum]GHO45949.1 spermidine/putrescine ABC transporter permease [Ktedonospora formicarum]
MQQQTTRFTFGLDKFILLLVVLYLVIPLGATLVFGLSNGSNLNLGVFAQIISDSDFSQTLLLSLGLAIASTIVAIVLITPTVYWVQLRLPQVRPVLEFLSLLPFAVPPIVLSLGYLEVFGNDHLWIDVLSLGLVPLLSSEPFVIVNTPQLLICAYVIIALPFIYRPIDNSLRALNTRVLTEAASSLGCGWWRTFLTIILPNIWPGVISAALLTFSTAMGEFTIAVLSGIYTFPVYLNQVGQGDAHKAASLTIMSFIITLICVLSIILLTRFQEPRRSPKA